MKKIYVLGAGFVGSAIAIDLHKSGYSVEVLDMNEAALDRMREKGVEASVFNFTSPGFADRIADADLLMGAAPGVLGYQIMEKVIRAGKNMVDISFCPEDFMELNGLAEEQGVTIVADMGVAPGMCNALLGFHEQGMKVESYRCLVGGLPFEREWPLEYKSSWSPMDCIDEYVRPARFREGGKDVVRPALSDLETVVFEECGKLEAWNSDGLRSLLSSYPGIPDMVEKTLRYPGTVKYLEVLRDLGYFSTEAVEVEGSMVRPLDLTAALLFPRFRLEEGEGEFTIMRVEIKGQEEGKQAEYVYDLYDEYHRESDTLSMARTTGYTATGAARLLLEGLLTRKGMIPPEKVALENDSMRFLMEHFRQRGVDYRLK